jgi:hypothetical protein
MPGRLFGFIFLLRLYRFLTQSLSAFFELVFPASIAEEPVVPDTQVSEKLLNDLQGNALFQKVSSKAVTQSVRSDRLGDSGVYCRVTHDFSD